MKPLLPETHTQTLFLVATRTPSYDSDQRFQYKVRLTPWNPEEGSNTDGAVLLSTHVMTVDVPQINPLQGEIEALEKIRTGILAEAQGKANQISEHIQKLLCIAHDED